MSMECFLIAHPKGNLMWDVGAIPDSSFRPAAAERCATGRSQNSDVSACRNRLRAGRYQLPGAFALSLGSRWELNLFAARPGSRPRPNATSCSRAAVSRTEPANFSCIEKQDRVPHEDEYDVFMDRTVSSGPLSPLGSSGSVFETRQNRSVVSQRRPLSLRRGAQLNRLPTSEFNVDQTVASRAAVEAYLKKSGSQLWIQHDFNGSAKLKKSPLFYE
jgi:hypothetical protein